MKERKAMGIMDALKSLATSWNQQGVSIWEYHDQKLTLWGEWCETDFPKHVAAYMQEGFEQGKSQWVEGNLTLFFVREWGIAFFGEDSMDTDRAKESLALLRSWFHLLKQVARQGRKEESLNSLVRVAHTIVSSIQSNRILDLILETAIETIPLADTGFLFLFDEQIHKLVVRSAVGFRRESYSLTRLEPGEGISGNVFQTGQAVLITGPVEIEATMGNMSSSNLKYYIDSTIYGSYPFGVISVPLTYQGHHIGVLTIDNFLSTEAFTKDDLQLLQAFADLAAVVIEHSKLFKKAHQQNDELSLMHQALSKEHERLQKTIDFHNQLTNIAAKGRGLEDILAALYQIVQVPVAIYDSLLSPVATCPEHFDHRLPDLFLRHPSMKLVNRTRKWQRIDLDEKKETIIVAPIVGTERLLGYLCAWTEPEGFIDVGKLIFEYSATVMALEWIKKEAIVESQERVKGQFLEDLLSGEINLQLLEQARYLGLEQDSHYAVMLIRKNNKANKEAKPSHWVSLVDRILDKQGIVGLIVPRGRIVVVIISFPDPFPVEKKRSLIRYLLDELKGRKDLQAGIGRIFKGLVHVGKSYKDAQQCFDLFDLHQPHQSVMYYGDFGVFRFLLQNDREELNSFLYDVLGPVLNYDLEKKGVLMDTLLAYVKYDRVLGKVTKELNIHYNTLYYRINRIQEILGRSFEQSEDWFSVQLACHIYRFFGKKRTDQRE
jgi:sugar diacid utilization regulator